MINNKTLCEYNKISKDTNNINKRFSKYNFNIPIIDTDEDSVIIKNFNNKRSRNMAYSTKNQIKNKYLIQFGNIRSKTIISTKNNTKNIKQEKYDFKNKSNRSLDTKNLNSNTDRYLLTTRDNHITGDNIQLTNNYLCSISDDNRVDSGTNLLKRSNTKIKSKGFQINTKINKLNLKTSNKFNSNISVLNYNNKIDFINDNIHINPKSHVIKSSLANIFDFNSLESCDINDIIDYEKKYKKQMSNLNNESKVILCKRLNYVSNLHKKLYISECQYSTEQLFAKIKTDEIINSILTIISILTSVLYFEINYSFYFKDTSIKTINDSFKNLTVDFCLIFNSIVNFIYSKLINLLFI